MNECSSWKKRLRTHIKYYTYTYIVCGKTFFVVLVNVPANQYPPARNVHPFKFVAISSVGLFSYSFNPVHSSSIPCTSSVCFLTFNSIPHACCSTSSRCSSLLAILYGTRHQVGGISSIYPPSKRFFSKHYAFLGTTQSFPCCSSTPADPMGCLHSATYLIMIYNTLHDMSCDFGRSQLS